jgi:predicted RNA binding protein YcfA (HicA-like mRNA interferase family)
MSKLEKIYEHILLKISDSNISFQELCALLIKLGFQKRVKGDHHIFTKNGIEEILNIQPKNGKGKAYQVKQVREIILRYNIRIGDE